MGWNLRPEFAGFICRSKAVVLAARLLLVTRQLGEALGKRFGNAELR